VSLTAVAIALRSLDSARAMVEQHELDGDGLKKAAQENKALAGTSRHNGNPDVAEVKPILDQPPWDDHEVTLYYFKSRKEISFARARVLGRPEVYSKRYERVMTDADIRALQSRPKLVASATTARARIRRRARAPASSRAACAADRAEAAADRVDAAATRAEAAADRTEAVVERMAARMKVASRSRSTRTRTSDVTRCRRAASASRPAAPRLHREPAVGSATRVARSSGTRSPASASSCRVHALRERGRPGERRHAAGLAEIQQGDGTACRASRRRLRPRRLRANSSAAPRAPARPPGASASSATYSTTERVMAVVGPAPDRVNVSAICRMDRSAAARPRTIASRGSSRGVVSSSGGRRVVGQLAHERERVARAAGRQSSEHVPASMSGRGVFAEARRHVVVRVADPKRRRRPARGSSR
jgi:hypothetical protein